MLIEGVEYDRKFLPPAAWDSDTIFLYCSFTGLQLDGPSVDGAMVRCTIERVDWYWGLFNTALVAHTAFKDSVFRGTSFRGVDFVSCTFERCRFVRDNLDVSCTFSDCTLTECTFSDCEFVPETRPEREPLFGNVRFYGCTQTNSPELVGIV